MVPYPLVSDGILRSTAPTDHPRVVSVHQNWWGGRDLAYALPRFFFDHFTETSLVVDRGEELIAFLIGFLSPSRKAEGYIHFAGVHPQYRNRGIAADLYRRFFDICSNNGRHTVKACTSPVNRGSSEFHKKMGFQIASGDAEIEGIPITLDYNRPGDPKVLFVRSLTE